MFNGNGNGDKIQAPDHVDSQNEKKMYQAHSGLLARKGGQPHDTVCLSQGTLGSDSLISAINGSKSVGCDG